MKEDVKKVNDDAKNKFFLKVLQINPLGTTCLQIHVKTNSVLKLIGNNKNSCQFIQLLKLFRQHKA